MSKVDTLNEYQSDNKVNKITQLDTIKAYQSFTSILKLNLSYPTIKKMRNIYKKLKDEYDFYQDEMKKIIDIYAEKDEHNEVKVNEDGNCKIPKDVMNLFISKVNELDSMEIENNFERIEINESEIAEQKITLEDILALEKFINFI